jgi:NADPH:quinone reductase-like Zn-dependent oxidoreductase
MKALIFRATGEPKSVLKLEKIPTTPPSVTGQALVRVAWPCDHSAQC